MALKHRLLDWVGSLFIPAIAICARRVRFNLQAYPRINTALRRHGVFPIIDHFYEPMITTDRLSDLNAIRNLPGIDLNIKGQLAVLEGLSEDNSINILFAETGDPAAFKLNNGYFENGDADLWFRVIQHFKPARIIEIGSGHSTKVARLALAQNLRDDSAYRCAHICIDPFAPDWLEALGPTVVREKVETLDVSVFAKLARSDILFIDSSHIIRPQGDVLFEYLEVLPSLAPGVIVHLHDIFTPRDYLADWVQNRHYFWNEQYLVEAFLTNNSGWEIILAGNMLAHEHCDLFRARCPSLDPSNMPRSLYIRKLG
jgi:Methyltransferase domain